MTIIDFRVRPPAKGFLNMIMYKDDARSIRLAQRLGLKLAPSAQQKSMNLLLSEMDAGGITLGVVPARISDFFGSVSNEDVADIVKSHSGRFIGFAAVDPTNRKAAIRQIDDALSAGFKGVNIEPGAYPVALYPDDRRLYPIYAHCEDRDVPIMIMSGGNAGPDLSYSFPVHVDRVAADFPNLKIVISHGGWPWVHEILHIAFRRLNVYLAPDVYLHGMPGADEYIKAANGFLAERFLYASCYPFAPVKEYAEWFQRLPLQPAVLERALWRNAAELLHI